MLCRLCKADKPTAKMRPLRPRYKTQVCIDCDRSTSRARYARIPLAKVRDKNLRRRYGITAAQYAAMSTTQSNACAICRKSPGARPLNVDHCHKTGAVRGLLCDLCNTAIGKFNDDPALLLAAVAYLKD